MLRNCCCLGMDIRNMDPKFVQALKVISLACPSLLVGNSKSLDVASDRVPPPEKLPTTTGREDNLHVPSVVCANQDLEQLANCTPFSVQALLEKKKKNSKSTPAQECFLVSLKVNFESLIL